MQRRQALFASSAAAVTLVTGSFGYAATNLMTSPSDDNVGKLVVTGQPEAARPVQVVVEEVPGEPPPMPASDDGEQSSTDDDVTTTPTTIDDSDERPDASHEPEHSETEHPETEHQEPEHPEEEHQEPEHEVEDD